MKKSLICFFCFINNSSEGCLKEWHIVEDTITKLSIIHARVFCIDGVERWVDYTISEFEYVWKVNLGKFELPKFYPQI
jgi:hypothetical protein